jgi:hypothetical protein
LQTNFEKPRFPGKSAACAGSSLIYCYTRIPAHTDYKSKSGTSGTRGCKAGSSSWPRNSLAQAPGIYSGKPCARRWCIRRSLPLFFHARCIASITHLPLKFHHRRSGVTSWPCVPPGECFPGAATLALCAPPPQRARGSIPRTVWSRANALAATITPTFGGPYSYTERGTNSSTPTQPQP